MAAAADDKTGRPQRRHRDDRTAARARLVESLREQGVRDEVVLAAMLAIPRHMFVEEALATRAYDNTPLPIGYGQTISQPYIVARMTELARAGRRPGNVLEIGTGCGYQTAILAHVSDAGLFGRADRAARREGTADAASAAHQQRPDQACRRNRAG
jgi:hypothetical protein